MHNDGEILHYSYFIMLIATNIILGTHRAYSFYDFIMRIGSSSNILIATLRENSFILAGPLRQKWVSSVHTIYN